MSDRPGDAASETAEVPALDPPPPEPPRRRGRTARLLKKASKKFKNVKERLLGSDASTHRGVDL